MIFTFWRRLIVGPLYFGGGGGGGDGGLVMQQQQENKKDTARQAINKIFGIEGRLPAPTADQFTRSVADTTGEGSTTLEQDPEAYQNALVSYGQQQQLYDAETAANKKAMTDAYGRVRQATLDVNKQKLDTDRQPAARQLRFALLRSGNSGGGLDIDQNNLLQRKYDQGVIDSTNAADSASLSAKTSDEKARLDLLSRVNAGLDQGSAIQGASQQLQTSADNAIQQAKGNVIGNVFDNAGLLYQANQQGNGVNSANAIYNSLKNKGFTNLPVGGSGGNGRVVNT